MKSIGFLSFGHWSPDSGAPVKTASDSLLQSIELAVAVLALWSYFKTIFLDFFLRNSSLRRGAGVGGWRRG